MITCKVLYNEDLSRYTTIKVGGIAKNMYFQHGIQELKEVAAFGTDYIIGGGSNLLIDNSEYTHVINMKEFDNNIENLGDGIFRVGSSVRLQKLINTINDNGYGGIEYLYSVPGLVGGATVMNAGPGSNTGKSISDYIEAVTVLQNGIVRRMEKRDCHFENRSSVFKNNSEYIILFVTFKFNLQNRDVSEALKKERIELCSMTQDLSGPNFGSVFSVCNYKIMNFIKMISIGKMTRAHYSHKTANWIINSDNNNNFKSIYNLIAIVSYLHKLFGKRCAIEVIIWDRH